MVGRFVVVNDSIVGLLVTVVMRIIWSAYVKPLSPKLYPPPPPPLFDLSLPFRIVIFSFVPIVHECSMLPHRRNRHNPCLLARPRCTSSQLNVGILVIEIYRCFYCILNKLFREKNRHKIPLPRPFPSRQLQLTGGLECIQLFSLAIAASAASRRFSANSLLLLLSSRFRFASIAPSDKSTIAVGLFD